MKVRHQQREGNKTAIAEGVEGLQTKEDQMNVGD